jgi:hypothetical protein
MIFSIYSLLLHKQWCTLPKDGQQMVETWNSLHRVCIKTAKFKSKSFCVHLSLIQSDVYWDFTKRMRKAAINVISFHSFLHLPVACTSATHTGKFFVKFLFYWNRSTHSDFGENRTKISHFTYSSVHMYNNKAPWMGFIIEICCILSSSYPSVFSLVGSFPTVLVASLSFQCCISVRSCVSGDLL